MKKNENNILSVNKSLIFFSDISIDGSPGNTRYTFIRVQSHDHSDHMGNFFPSLGKNKYVILHPATYDFIKAKFPKKSVALDERNNIIKLDYEKDFTTDEYKISLFNSGHMLGGSQVLIEELKSGERLLYSSDIGPETISKKYIIPKCDKLVIDATCGSTKPNEQISYEDSMNELFDLLIDQINNGFPIQISGNRGTIEKVISRFIEEFPRYEVFVSDKIKATLPVYNKYGIGIADLSNISELDVFKTERYAYFCTPEESEKSPHNKEPLYITLKGLYPNIHEIIDNRHYFHVTNHASYETVLEYILESDAKEVIIDSIRAKESRVDSLYNSLREEKYLEGKKILKLEESLL